MKRASLECLDDMADHARKAIAFVGDLDFTAFEADERTLFATIRALEIVGEAARGVAPEIRALGPEIAWLRSVGMRNFLAHDYMGANSKVVFDTVRFFVPALISQLAALRASIDASGPPR